MTSKNPEIKTFKTIVSILERADVPYMLTGSMALNFYGQPRATNDFDIVIAIQDQHADILLNLLEERFYVSRQAAQEAITNQTIFNIVDYQTIFKVDLIVRKSDVFSLEQFERRTLKNFSGISAMVISPEDLILAKLDWSKESRSEMQERDIKNLIQTVKSLDRNYLESKAKILGYEDRLRKFYA